MRFALENAWLIPFFPLLGALLNGLVGKRFGKLFVSVAGVGTVGIAFAHSVWAFLALREWPDRSFSRDLWSWIPMASPSRASFEAPVGFLLDPLSLVMILVVTGVGLLIHVYSIGYMGHDEGYSRYFAYLNLFTASMLTLVMANNLLLMFVGWEGVGLCSYLLIGFWYEKESAATAGKKAFLVNRVGDAAFLLGMLLLFTVFGTLRFTEIAGSAGALHAQGILTTSVATAIALLLFVGATGKSAQLPLWVWLPDAMEGPTPVSALIHAATMVTAGVYLIVRLAALYALAPVAGGVVALVGALTALFAATIALTQFDLKRVLAYSTISQLGLMFLAAGVGAYTAAIFHLTTHAFFKGLLFLGAGSVMHAMGNRIDIREMGGLRRYLPATHWTFLAGTLAISGFPLLAGWWSKDEILAEAFHLGTRVWWAPGWLLWALGSLASLLTAFYMVRAYTLAFHSDPRIDPEVEAHLHESPRSMTGPLWVLAGLSIVGGAALALPELWGHAGPVEAFLAPVWAHASGVHAAEAGHATGPAWGLMGVATLLAFAGMGAAWSAYRQRLPSPEPLERARPMWNLFDQKWYLERGYHALFVRGGTWLAGVLAGAVDQKGVDRAVVGIGSLVALTGEGLRRLQTGYVRSYALSIVVGAVLLAAYFMGR
jgi:NADH-quinone oxidoreductase subunit L